MGAPKSTWRLQWARLSRVELGSCGAAQGRWPRCLAVLSLNSVLVRMCNMLVSLPGALLRGLSWQVLTARAMRLRLVAVAIRILQASIAGMRVEAMAEIHRRQAGREASRLPWMSVGMAQLPGRRARLSGWHAPGLAGLLERRQFQLNCNRARMGGELGSKSGWLRVSLALVAEGRHGWLVDVSKAT